MLVQCACAPCAKTGRGRGIVDAAHRQQLQPRIPRDLAERDDDLQAGQMRDLVGQMRQAAVDFFRQRLVRRRRAAHRRGDVDIRQRQSIVDALRRRDVREAGALERRHQEVAGCADAVAGEHAAGPIGAVGGGRQAQDQDARLRIAKARDRPRPIDVVPERRLPRPPDIQAIGAQPRALLAANDGVPNGRQRGRTVSAKSAHVLSLQHVTSGRRRPDAFNSPPIPLEWFDCLIVKYAHIRKV